MTNAEKYLKDNVSVEELAKEFQNFVLENSNIEPHTFENEMKEFLYEQVQPTLTEDERVILNHINIYEFDKIGRAKNGDLYLHYKEDKDTEDFWWCDHLFQFIKERRRIFY